MKRLISVVILCFLLVSCGLPQDGHGTYEYDKGIQCWWSDCDHGTYVGEFKNGKRHGEGRYDYGDKKTLDYIDKIYVGGWKDDKRHGLGVYSWTSVRERYDGEWKDDKYHGQGTYTWAGGHKYVGEWKDGKKHGQGTWIYLDGGKYVGELKDHKRHGQGTHTWANGTKYVGGWRNGNEHGQGTLTGADGMKYVGEWKDGKKHGQGTWIHLDRGKYVGEWKDSKQHGQGTYTSGNGEKYVGEWKDGQQNGQGTQTSANGDKYVGEFKDGKMHGQGTLTQSDGGKYVGESKDGKPNGQGTQTWADGAKYVGEWKDNKQHGQGTFTSAGGDKEVGQHKYGHFWTGTFYNASGEVTGKQSDGMAEPSCDGNLSGGLGTGFSVNQYQVVTNAHVLYCCKNVTVYSLGSCSDGEEATVVATEQRSDLGLLRLDKPLKHYATLRSGKELQLGEAVLTYDRKPQVNGCPQYDVGQGNVTKLNWMPDDSRLMSHNAPIGAGSSGGPILDASGHIIGVTQAKRGVDTEAAAVKPHLLGAFLKSNNVEYNTAPSTEELSLSEIKKKSDKFTVIIDCIR